MRRAFNWGPEPAAWLEQRTPADTRSHPFLREKVDIAGYQGVKVDKEGEADAGEGDLHEDAIDAVLEEGRRKEVQVYRNE